MSILVLNKAILAVDPVDAGDAWTTPDQIIPKHIADGAVLVDVALPADYAPGKYTYDNQFVPVPVPQAQTDAQASAVRATRNAKLAECDWTQLGDASVDQAAWATYRQALRDLPQQAGFPWNVTWPVAP